MVQAPKIAASVVAELVSASDPAVTWAMESSSTADIPACLRRALPVSTRLSLNLLQDFGSPHSGLDTLLFCSSVISFAAEPARMLLGRASVLLAPACFAQNGPRCSMTTIIAAHSCYWQPNRLSFQSEYPRS